MGKKGSKKLYVNYLYFGAFFLILVFLHSLHFFLIERKDFLLQLFLMGDVVFQSLFEVLLLIGICSLVSDYLPKAVAALCSIAVFVLLLIHILDFLLVRLSGTTAYAWIGFVFQESLENFVEMLLASGLPLLTWIIGGAAGCALLLFGGFLFRFTQRIARKAPLKVSYASFGRALCAMTFAFFSWNVLETHFPTSRLHGEYYKLLPWKRSLFLSKEEFLVLPYSLKAPGSEEKECGQVEGGMLAYRPDIFLFVIESLREDFITPRIAPHLSRFRQQNTAFNFASSSANATQSSWFSLFYSRYPFYWELAQNSASKKGAPPLRMLKKMGYEIHVYSSSRLSYYKMDELLFGEQRYLADIYSCCPSGRLPHWKSDVASIEALNTEIVSSKKGGRLFIVFLESTHFDYSWPLEEPFSFEPVVDKIDYLKVAVSKEDLEKIQNRYRNAIHYVDHLFGSFEETLKKNQLWQDALVVVTGDHGEEFYEEGNVFHASNLSRPQTHVPLYCKLNTYSFPSCPIVSHMDIFPTLFHVLLEAPPPFSCFQGQSVFAKNRCHFAVAARYNASRNPCEFFIHNGKYKMTARFSNEKDIFRAKELYLMSVKDCNDTPVAYTPAFVEAEFGAALNAVFAP